MIVAKVSEQLHRSKLHRPEGFDPRCPVCIKREGIPGILVHLQKCANQNERDGDIVGLAIAAEQRRMSAILRLLEISQRTRQQVPDRMEENL